MNIHRLCISLLIVVAVASCSDDKMSLGQKLDGSVTLYDEFGSQLSSHEGVQVDFELESDKITTFTDESGDFSLNVPAWEKVISISYTKDGFTSRKVIDLEDEPNIKTAWLVKLSTIEVYNLQAVAMDLGGPHYEISFEVENFFSDDLDQARYFNLLVYDLQGGFINSIRFKAFQKEEHWSGDHTFEVLSGTRARITYRPLWVSILFDYPSDEDLEFRVHGATDFEIYKHIHRLENEIDNSLNETYSSTIVKTN